MEEGGGKGWNPIIMGVGDMGMWVKLEIDTYNILIQDFFFFVFG